MTATIKIMWGVGGFARVVIHGKEGQPAKVHDLTAFAEVLVSLGVEIARTIAVPSEVDGFVEVDLGQGGRALWVEGGGDLGTGDVLAAISATLERGVTPEFTAAVRARRIRIAGERVAAFEDALVELGASRRAARAFFRRTRTTLGGLSILQVWENGPGERTQVAAALVGDHLGALTAAIPDPQERARRMARAFKAACAGDDGLEELFRERRSARSARA